MNPIWAGGAVYVVAVGVVGVEAGPAFVLAVAVGMGASELVDRLDRGGGRADRRAARREQSRAIERAHRLYRTGEIDDAELDRQIDDALRSEERHRIRRAMDDVPHVGGETADALWSRFEVLEGIERASGEELEAVNGVGESRAASIRERFE